MEWVAATTIKMVVASLTGAPISDADLDAIVEGGFAEVEVCEDCGEQVYRITTRGQLARDAVQRRN